MSSLDILNKRLQYQGGNQEGRFIKDKLKSLKKALLYSYQAETAVLADEREFRCLINPDKLKPEYDNKIISIPYRDVCLNKDMMGITSKGEEEIGLKPGDVFCWKETKTYWLVYLQYLEENAYFRAELRRCKYEIEINGNKYRIYVRGPVETTVPWNQKQGIVWNDINYSLVIYITKNEETLQFFHRFSKIKFNGKPWEVQAINEFDADGIIEVYLDEDYQNSIEDAEKEEIPAIEIPDKDSPHIEGNIFVKPYDIIEYKVLNAENGFWTVSNDKVKIIKQDSFSVTIEIITGKSGYFDLIYNRENEENIILSIKIESL